MPVSNSHLTKIECIDISDIHTGHRNTPTENILTRLSDQLMKVIEKKKFHFLFISGDFFDSLLNLPLHSVREIHRFISWLLRTCKKHEIRLRVLEGTPSHDWKQNSLFVQINEDSAINADIRYLDKLCIDYEEAFGLNILYVPDEWDESTEETLRQVRELLKEKQLESVDLAIMHGMFEFQVPNHLRNKMPLHNQEAYEAFVKHLIVIGHDHRHKASGKIVVPGSFDRLVHGDEDPKGFITFTLYPNKPRVDITFVENKEAEIYRTIDVTDKAMEEALIEIEQVVFSIPVNSKVRLLCKDSNPIMAYLQSLPQRFPMVVWSKPKLIKEVVENKISEVLEQSTYTAVVLNPENIEEKLMQQVESKGYDISLTQAKQLLKEVVSNVRSY